MTHLQAPQSTPKHDQGRIDIREVQENCGKIYGKNVEIAGKMILGAQILLEGKTGPKHKKFPKLKLLRAGMKTNPENKKPATFAKSENNNKMQNPPFEKWPGLIASLVQLTLTERGKGKLVEN